MPRPPALPDRSEIAEEEVPFYDRVRERAEAFGKGTLSPYWSAVGNWPEYGDTLGTQGRLVRTAGDRTNTYSHVEREWVDQVLCHDWGTNIVLKGHIPDALAAGVRLEAIEALRGGREEELTEDEQFLTGYIRGVDRGTVTDEMYEELEDRMGRRGAAEYTIFIAHLIRTIRLHQAFGLADITDGEVDEMLADFREGRRQLPDFRARLM